MKNNFQNLSENTHIQFRCCMDKKLHKAVIQSIVEKKRGKTIYSVIKQDASGTAFLHIPSDSITKILKDKGIVRKGKLEFIEKKKTIKKTMILELTPEIEIMLKKYVKAIDELLKCDEVPPVLGKSSCKKCAYYEYCYI